MRFGTLSEELNSIIKDYDYGIVPGSAAVFVKDEVMGIGRLDLILLESVIVVIEVSHQGYKIASSSPLYSAARAAAEHVQTCVDRDCFDSMESLLMKASPMFCERFQALSYNNLDNVRRSQYPYDNRSMTYSPSPSPSQQQQQQQQQQVTSLPHSYHGKHTIVPPTAPAMFPPSLYTPTAPTSTQQDLTDEINKWIH